MKKIVSLLTIVALIAVLAIATFAADEVALKVDTVEAVPGDEVVINVSLVNNPGVTVGEFKMTYDTTALELVSMTAVGGADWNWSPVANDKNGMFVFAANGADLLAGDEVLVTLTFKVKEGTLPGSYEVKAAVDFIGDDDGDFIVGTDFLGAVNVLCVDHVAGDVVIENVVESTCTVAGSHDEVTYCSICGIEMARETVTDALAEHTPAEPVIENETEGSCLMPATYEEVVYCSVCGAEISRTTVEGELGEHVAGEAVMENAENADCQTPGSYDLVVYCTVCGEELSREHVEGELGQHTAGEPVIENEVAGTDCQTKGSYDEVVYCTVCGEELSRETKEGTAGEHKLETVTTEATCCEDGLTVVKCAVCGEVVEETVLPATGEHALTYVDNADGKTHKVICANTGKELKDEDHVYGDYIEDAENPGWKYQVCEKCGYKHLEEVPTGDHSMIAVVVAALSITGIAVVVSKKKEF